VALTARRSSPVLSIQLQSSAFSVMNQIFSHRAPEPTTLLHDLPPPGWFYRRYRKHGFNPKPRIPIGKLARRK
jgi:hypothetical protein